MLRSAVVYNDYYYINTDLYTYLHTFIIKIDIDRLCGRLGEMRVKKKDRLIQKRRVMLIHNSGGAGGGNKMMKNWNSLEEVDEDGGIAIKCTRGRGY